MGPINQPVINDVSAPPNSLQGNEDKPMFAAGQKVGDVQSTNSPADKQADKNTKAQKAAKTSPSHLLAITIAVVISAALVAAAIFAFKQSS